MTDSRHDRRAGLPPRLLPLLYFAVARFALLVALGIVAVDPAAFAVSFYHARMLAVVHLVTLGWLTCSILGSIYIVGPFAMRVALPARLADYSALALAACGVGGVAAGFWWNLPMRAGWAGALLLPAVGLVGVRVVSALRHAPVQGAVVLHVALAFGNFVLAASAGIAIALDKPHAVLPGSLLSNVFAHAHLAGVGWVGMMAVGIGYRLFPMVLPAAMPEGGRLYTSALLLELGTLTLAAALVLDAPRGIAAGAAFIAAGFVAFLFQVRGMLATRKAPPAALPRPDYGAWQSLMAVLCLSIATVLGLYLAVAPWDGWTVRVAATYGVFGLVGFLSQLVAGMEYRLLPYHAWYWAFANTGFKGPAANPHEMPVPGLQRAAFFLWLAGVPLLAAGTLLVSPRLLATGASLLLLAVALGAVDAIVISAHAFAPAQRR